MKENVEVYFPKQFLTLGGVHMLISDCGLKKAGIFYANVLLTVFALISPSRADIIRGTVTDQDDNTPIANVKVGVGPTHFTLTGVDGKYELNTDAVSVNGDRKAGPPRLDFEASSQTFSWIGYAGETVIEIRNARGERVGHPASVTAETRFRMPDLAQGLYFVHFSMGSYGFQQKVAKLGAAGYATQGSAPAFALKPLEKTALANTVTFERTDYASTTKDVNGSLDGVDMKLKRGPVATLDNGLLNVKFDRASEKVTLATAGGKVFFEEATLNRTGGNAKVVDRTDKTFGKGLSIEIAYAGGHINRIMLYPGVPFAMFQTGVKNSGTGPQLLRKQPTLSGYVNNIGSNLKTLGTQGLNDANQQSYSYIAVADPATRNGVVAGWLTHDRGNGVVFSTAAAPRAKLDARIEYGTLNIRPNTLEEMEVLGVGYFADARLGMEAWADNVAKVYDIHLRPQPNGFVTWYSDKCQRGGDQTCVPQLADWINTHGLRNFGFSFIQIDDYWQAGLKGGNDGPAKNFNMVDPTGPYSNGMKPVADKIKAAGLTAGIWFMPFSGNLRDPFFSPHKDWFVKGADGNPPENHWAIHPLDMSSKGARDNLTGFTARMSKEWGFKYFKMDGLYHGTAGDHLYTQNNYSDDWETAPNRPVSFADQYQTPIENMRNGLKAIRAAAGDDVFLLGCSLIMNLRALSGAVGLVDAFRVGPDNNYDWARVTKGPQYGTKFFHFNKRLWYNDPDPVYLRAAVPVTQTRAMCSWAGITGQFTVHSDWLPDVPAAQLDIFKRVIPTHQVKNVRPVDIFDRAMANVWVLSDTTKTPRRDVLFAINWDAAAAMTQSYTFDKLGLVPGATYVGFDFWANKFLPPFTGSRSFLIPGADCQVIAVRQVADYPMVISTNRHVTQGVIDIASETWDAGTKTLSGVSHVVAGDMYELRIVTAKAGGNWAPASAKVSAADAAANVTVDAPALDGANVRVKIHSPNNRDVSWSVVFN
jgi:hypothetical protein